ncbi:O-acyltransferase like protein [Anopheles marshallii]|uniref:O-acyltransferase like protein n=1 Tax=Anopheles marshallii TaxID=1521116 RepID=UPI00237B2555|nr:O-acyltransferase like protein [Anopheles marshallii]
MVTVSIRIVRLRERRMLSWCSLLLLVQLLQLAYGTEERPVGERLSPFPGSGGWQTYATPNTQLPPSVRDLSAADHNVASRHIAHGNERVNRRESIATTVDRLDPSQADLVLPNYETSSARTGGLPPVYKYTDNVFRVPKRKAKTSAHPETGTLPRKSHANRSLGTGRTVMHQGDDAAWSSSTASVAYAPGNAAALVEHRAELGLSEETLFQLFTSLFDHGNWNILELKGRVGEQCAAHIGLYLRDLRRQRGWALKASDSSGRYGGQYFFGNEFWMGSLTFCDEVNRVLRLTPMPPGARHLEMRFFVAKISVQLERLLSTQSSSILLGQCLPKSCTVEDITELLRSDPMLNLLNNSTLNVVVASTPLPNGSPANAALTILHVRPVPGSYNLWSDPKVFALLTVLAVLSAVIAYASCGTGTDGKPKARGWPKKVHDSSVPGGDGHHMKRERGVADGGRMGDAFEMHKINVESNNNVSGGNGQQAPATDGMYKDRKATRFTLHDILSCFDVGPNAASILSVERAGEDSLTCVHGLRLYSLLWTVLVHTYLQLFAVSENRYGRKIAERSFLYQLVGNASFSVDTFFFISGLLIVYLYLKSVTKSGQPASKTVRPEESNGSAAGGNRDGPTSRNTSLAGSLRKVGLSILYRYLRLTPVYWFTIVTNEIILKWTYDRSVFTPGIIDHITCDRFWWRNILYVNNWFPFTEMCMIWSWYLANDMQFYVIAIVLLMISSRNFRLAAGLLFLCLGGSWLLSIYFSLHYRYTHKVADPFESFDILYDKPWQRIGPYIVGMITGYILHRRPNAPRIVPPLRLLLWTISTGILIALIFGVWNGELSVHWTACYVSVGHTAWGLALMWITLSCCWGYSNFVNGLLSYRGFFPLSRLAYCTYLIHPVVMMATSFQLEAPMHLQHVIIITAFFGNAVISFLIAFGMSLMFEAPVIKLLKLFFQKT